MSSVGAIAVLTADLPAFGFLFTAIVMITEHLLVTVAVVFWLLLIWAIVMPAWIERLFDLAWKKLYVMIAISFIPIVVLMVLDACGLKLGAGLNP